MGRVGVPILCALALCVAAYAQDAPVRNGFTLAPTSVPPEEILRGGPPRDGIPALDHPPHAKVGKAGWSQDEPVIGVRLGGEARAYPLALLVWHELVNDTLGGQPILVSYCPLCGTGIVFERAIAGSVHRFGVSGLLYRSDLLLYDHDTESLWSQIAARAIAGPSVGKRLTLVRARMTRLGDWAQRESDTTVLTRETGHRRDYGRSPYGDYAFSERLMFPVPLDRRYHPKMPTLGLRQAAGAARAYPAAELVRAGGRAEERFAGTRVAVTYDPDREIFEVEAPPEIEVVEGYWFAWIAFHPESSVFTAGASGGGEPPRSAAPTPGRASGAVEPEAP